MALVDDIIKRLQAQGLNRSQAIDAILGARGMSSPGQPQGMPGQPGRQTPVRSPGTYPTGPAGFPGMEPQGPNSTGYPQQPPTEANPFDVNRLRTGSPGLPPQIQEAVRQFQQGGGQLPAARPPPPRGIPGQQGIQGPLSSPGLPTQSGSVLTPGRAQMHAQDAQREQAQELKQMMSRAQASQAPKPVQPTALSGNNPGFRQPGRMPTTYPNVDPTQQQVAQIPPPAQIPPTPPQGSPASAGASAGGQAGQNPLMELLGGSGSRMGMGRTGGMPGGPGDFRSGLFGTPESAAQMPFSPAKAPGGIFGDGSGASSGGSGMLDWLFENLGWGG